MIDADTAAKYLAIAAAIGAAIPFLQSLIQAPWWSAKVKAALSLGLSILAAVVAYVIKTGSPSPARFDRAVGTVGISPPVAVPSPGLWRPPAPAPKRERAPAKTTDVPEPAVMVPAGAVVDSDGHPTGEVDN